jgi:DNA-binding GntR family transcriptional regulator
MPRKDAAVPVEPLEREGGPSLVSSIAERVERMIVKGEIDIGGKLNELALSQQLQVSRSALREAIRLLEPSGLVTILPNRGVFVRRVSLEEALDIFDIRAGLVYVAGQLAARRASEQALKELEEFHQGMIAAWEQRDFDRYYQTNFNFHSAILRAAGNERLASLYDMMSNELHLFRRRNLGNSAQLELSIQEHAKILQALQARDELRAGRAFEKHVLIGKQRMIDTLSFRSES